MFRTVSLSIISSFSLYTQQYYMSYRLRAGSGRSVLILLAIIVCQMMVFISKLNNYMTTEGDRYRPKHVVIFLLINTIIQHTIIVVFSDSIYLTATTLVVSFLGCYAINCIPDTTPAYPHLTSNLQQTKNETTNVVINIIVARS